MTSNKHAKWTYRNHTAKGLILLQFGDQDIVSHRGYLLLRKYSGHNLLEKDTLLTANASARTRFCLDQDTHQSKEKSYFFSESSDGIFSSGHPILVAHSLKRIISSVSDILSPVYLYKSLFFRYFTSQFQLNPGITRNHNNQPTGVDSLNISTFNL